ncbi:arylsulfotransferase family protein [Solicola gregarius]|uniref:Arylsulfotransferase family protein n=1 Tax=Solicola gregarius TaxID=2908642 RepID=A0AA46YPR0_9ACTN|nr:arylsulfotransferase family protein [Solicola gregarius]UYM07873.1 arylsulfotransferase family protein [Solicola gregarius]
MGDMTRLGAAVAAVLVTIAACAPQSDSTAGEPTEDPAASEEAADVQEFVGRPDLPAPMIDVTGDTSKAAPGLVFLAPKGADDPMHGPTIVDSDGDPVWINPVGDRWTYDFRMQHYQGKPVLTWWQGKHLAGGYGRGEYVLMDTSYNEIATVTTPGLGADFHNMTLTSHGTALMTSFPIVRRDLRDIGGPKNGYVANCVVQEVDVKTGKVRFRWNMLDHVPLTETIEDPEHNPEEPGTKQAPLDPYHVNSVNEDGKDGLLVSARNTSALYRIDESTGKVDWTLGGSGSDFEMTGNSEFAYQHDAQRQPDGTITLFDNEAWPQVGDESRGLRLALDEKHHTARVVEEYLPPDDRLSSSQGNMQVLPGGHVVIGWGSEEYYSEYTHGGKLLYDAAVDGQSYRVHRSQWHATPTEPPKVVYEDGTAYASWNGATEVASWRFVAGSDKASARVVATVPRDGFETSVDMPDRPYVAAQALDAKGKVLATAEPGLWP